MRATWQSLKISKDSQQSSISVSVTNYFMRGSITIAQIITVYNPISSLNRLIETTAK